MTLTFARLEGRGLSRGWRRGRSIGWRGVKPSRVGHDFTSIETVDDEVCVHGSDGRGLRQVLGLQAEAANAHWR